MSIKVEVRPIEQREQQQQFCRFVVRRHLSVSKTRLSVKEKVVQLVLRVQFKLAMAVY